MDRTGASTAGRLELVPDPLEALPHLGDPRKVTELTFSSRRATKLHPHFKRFINLEVLILDHNRLILVDGLVPDNDAVSRPSEIVGTHWSRGCFRLRSLHVQDNRLISLRGSIPSLTQLEELFLSNNQIKDLEECLQYLRPLERLRVLDLSSNPVAEELSFRLTLIHHLPRLEILNRQLIQGEERRRARMLFSPRAVRSHPFGRHAEGFEPVGRVGDRTVTVQ